MWKDSYFHFPINGYSVAMETRGFKFQIQEVVLKNWEILGKTNTTRAILDAKIIFGRRRNKNLYAHRQILNPLLTKMKATATARPLVAIVTESTSRQNKVNHYR